MILRAPQCDDDRCDYDTNSHWQHHPQCPTQDPHAAEDMAATTSMEDGYTPRRAARPQALTALAIANRRQTTHRPAFLDAFLDTWARQPDADIEALVSEALHREQYATVAGLLEGAAALNAAAGMPREAAPIPRGRLAGITTPRTNQKAA